MRDFITTILLKLLTEASKEVREVLRMKIQELGEHAKKTANPVDDILVQVLETLLDITSKN